MKKILITALVLAGFSATAQVKVGSNPTTLATDANFQVEATDGTQFFINKPNGNVGIGTTTPTAQLEIGEGTGEQGIKVYGGDSSQKYLTLGTSETDRWSIVSNGLDNSFLLYGNHTADGNGIKLPFLITRYGRVGIGNNINDVINDIYSDLQVGRGALGTSGHIVIHGGNDSQAALSLGTSLTDRWHIISQPNNSLTIGEDHSSDGGQTEANITINPGGNVGIGTSTPTAKLDVAGSIKMVDGSQAAGAFMVSDANGKATWTPAATALGAASSKWTNDAANTRVALTNLSDGTTARPAGTEFVVTDAGNVGIGTTTPNVPLAVGNTFSTTTGASIKINNSLEFDFDGVNGTQRHARITPTSDNSGGAYGGGLSLERYYDNGGSYTFGPVLTIAANGNVGIGTTNPTSKLAVVGLPVYADNTAAAALSVGDFYRTATGVVMVKY